MSSTLQQQPKTSENSPSSYQSQNQLRREGESSLRRYPDYRFRRIPRQTFSTISAASGRPSKPGRGDVRADTQSRKGPCQRDTRATVARKPKALDKNML